jgi:hypothetical protein
MWKVLILALLAGAAQAGPSTVAAPSACAAGATTCCCTSRDGLRCCGSAGNCASGVVPGCNCAPRP